MDVTFKGYSPRINGYIGKENFERFKVATTFDYPYFPFKSTELDGNKLMHGLMKIYLPRKSMVFIQGCMRGFMPRNQSLFLRSILPSNLVKIWINMKGV